MSEISACTDNNFNIKLWDTIIHSCRYFNSVLKVVSMIPQPVDNPYKARSMLTAVYYLPMGCVATMQSF